MGKLNSIRKNHDFLLSIKLPDDLLESFFAHVELCSDFIRRASIMEHDLFLPK